MSHGNHFLDSLNPADAEALRPLLRETSLEVGQILIEQGAAVEVVHFPAGAQLANLIVFADGAAIETAVVGREGISGLAPFMADEPSAWRVAVRAAGPAWAAPAGTVREHSYRSRAFMAQLLRLTHVYQAQGAQVAACNANHRTTARVARWLLMAADLNPGQPLAFTQEELAALLGAQRTTVNEATNRLKDSGAIRYSRGVIRVLDHRRLEGSACECYEMHRAVSSHAGVLPET